MDGTANLPVSVVEATGLPSFGDLGAPSTLAITGRIFEDVNYGGGVGRSQASSSGVALANARVELYDSLGAFVTAQNSDVNGDYGFRPTPGTYRVRVVNSTVRPRRLEEGAAPNPNGAAPATLDLPLSVPRPN